jgi:hypothetical protein
VTQNLTALQIRKSFKNSVFQQQVYSKRFLPYSLNEQEKVTRFVTLFFKQLEIRVHSFNVVKDQKGNMFYAIKYAHTRKDSRGRKSKKTLLFSSLENSLCLAFQRVAGKKPLNILLYEITVKYKTPYSRPPLFRGFKFTTLLELTKTSQIIENSDGFAYYLTCLFCEKLGNLRSKADKNLQGRLILFFEKLLYFWRHSGINNQKGIRVEVAGRINGASRSKTTSFTLGALPLQKMSVDVDFCYKESNTVFGCFGVKVWAKYF